MRLVNLMDKMERLGVVQPARVGADGKPEAVSHVCQLIENKGNEEEDSHSDGRCLRSKETGSYPLRIRRINDILPLTLSNKTALFRATHIFRKEATKLSTNHSNTKIPLCPCQIGVT